MLLLDGQAKREKNLSFSGQTTIFPFFYAIERQRRNAGKPRQLRFAEHLRFANFFYVVRLFHCRHVPADPSRPESVDF